MSVCHTRITKLNNEKDKLMQQTMTWEEFIDSFLSTYERMFFNEISGQYDPRFVANLKRNCPPDAYRYQRVNPNTYPLLVFYNQYYGQREISTNDFPGIIRHYIQMYFDRWVAEMQQTRTTAFPMNNNGRVLRTQSSIENFVPNVSVNNNAPINNVEPDPWQDRAMEQQKQYILQQQPPQPMVNNNPPVSPPVQPAMPKPTIITSLDISKLKSLDYKKLYSDPLESDFFDELGDDLKKSVKGYLVDDIIVNERKTIILTYRDNKPFSVDADKINEIVKDKILKFPKLKDYNYILIDNTHKLTAIDVPVKVIHEFISKVKDAFMKKKEAYSDINDNGEIFIKFPNKYNIKRIDAVNDIVNDMDPKYKDKLNTYLGKVITNNIFLKFSSMSNAPDEAKQVTSLQDYYTSAEDNVDIGGGEDNKKIWDILNSMVVTLFEYIIDNAKAISDKSEFLQDFIQCSDAKNLVSVNYKNLLDPKLMELEVDKLYDKVTIIKFPYQIITTNLFSVDDIDEFTYDNNVTSFGYSNLDKRNDKLLILLKTKYLGDSNKIADKLVLIDDTRSNMYLKEFHVSYPCDLLLNLPNGIELDYLNFKDMAHFAPRWNKIG